MFRRTLFVAAALVATLPAAVRADQWDAQVRVKMLRAVASAAPYGFGLRHPLTVGQMRQGQAITYDITFAAGTEYILVGNCDRDCGDLDLIVIEPDGRELVADRRFDSQAVVSIPTSHVGAHTVRVRMAACSTGPCRFGLGVFTN
jgi:hypothetical protein